MTTPLDAAKRILELEEMVTTGPFYVRYIEKGIDDIIYSLRRHDGRGVVELAQSVYATENDFEFFAEARTLAPEVAKAYIELEVKLKEAVELLKESKMWLKATTGSSYMDAVAEKIDKFLSEVEK